MQPEMDFTRSTGVLPREQTHVWNGRRVCVVTIHYDSKWLKTRSRALRKLAPLR
jgi:hypothetical protein